MPVIETVTKHKIFKEFIKYQKDNYQATKATVNHINGVIEIQYQNGEFLTFKTKDVIDAYMVGLSKDMLVTTLQ